MELLPSYIIAIYACLESQQTGGKEGMRLGMAILREARRGCYHKPTVDEGE